MDHLALPVIDQERSRRFYETYFGFGARPARRYDDDVLMLYNGAGFALALGHADGAVARPAWMHFGVRMPDAGVLALRDRLAADGVELVEEWTSRLVRQVPRSERLHRRGGVGAVSRARREWRCRTG